MVILPWFLFMALNLLAIEVLKGSIWWRDLINLDAQEPTGRFSSCISRKLGNGSLVDFWKDHWLGHAPLSLVYPNLFAGCDYQSVTVVEVGEWTRDTWSWNLPLMTHG